MSTPTIQQIADGCLQLLKEGNYPYVVHVWTEFKEEIEAHPLWEPRFHAWFCQAYLQMQQPKEALRHCYTGARCAKIIQDRKGVEVFAQLQSQATTMLSEQHPPKPTVPIDGSDQLLLDADQAIQDGNLGLAEHLCSEAMQLEDPKIQVLALLTLAKIPEKQESALQQAYDRAQQSDDFNLITLVKKSFDGLGIDLPVHIF